MIDNQWTNSCTSLGKTAILVDRVLQGQIIIFSPTDVIYGLFSDNYCLEKPLFLTE